MKRYSKLFLVGIFCLLTIFSGTAYSAGKVVIFLGITEDYFTTENAFVLSLKAVKEALTEEKIPFEIIYSKLDETTDEAARLEVGKEAGQRIRQCNPMVIIALGDYAIKHTTSNITDIPIVGAFFFSPPEAIGLTNSNATGVVRGSYAADIWKVAKQLTGAKSVGMLSRNSFAMQGVRKVIMAKAGSLEQETGVKLTDMYLCDSFDDWENYVKNWSEDLIYIIDSGRLTRGEKVFTNEETVQWTVENSKAPVIATNEMDTRNGAMFSIVVSEPAWGHRAAAIALKILSGTPVSEIPLESVKEGNLLVNAKTVQKYNIEIPYEILETAAHIYE